MNEVIQLAEMSLETLTALAKESFEDCAEPLRLILENEQRLNRFAEILRACKAKVPHGKWQQWVEETFAGQVSIRAIQVWMSDAKDPDKRQKRLESERDRQQKMREPKAQYTALLPEEPRPAPPAAPATIRHESPPTPQPQPERPAWLADPDEMGLPPADDLPPQPKTNVHYTPDNRRQPDARETDRQGLVTIDDPRDYVDGAWYEFDESAGRLFAVTHDQILQRAAQVMAIRSREVMKAARSGSPTPESCDTKTVVERTSDTKRFVRPTVAEVAAYAKEIGAAIDPEQFCDFYESKAWMIGKNKMKDWKAAVRTWKRQQAGKAGSVENGKVRSANWEDDGTGWEDLRDG